MWDDIVTNIVLFMPLGYALATLARRAGFTTLRGGIVVVLTSAGLSLFVEILQLYLPFRFSSFSDITANACGGGIGYAINALFGRRIASHVRAGTRGVENRKTIFWLVTAYAGHLVFILMLSYASYAALMFVDWGWEYPLVVGNEPAGTRPWLGTIYRFAVGPAVTDEDIVLRSLASDSLSLTQPRSLSMDFIFNGRPPYRDHGGNVPPLDAKGYIPFPDQVGATIMPQRWLETVDRATSVCGQLYSGEGFSMFLKLQSNSLEQLTQARIFCIADDIQRLNMALTQEGTDLCFRYRTMATGHGGTSPMFAVRGVFADTLPHSILLTYKQLKLDVYVDRVAHKHSFTIGPGLAVFNRFLPTRRKINIASPLAQANEWLFAFAAFVPLGYLLALIIRRLEHNRFFAALALLVGAIGPVYAVAYIGTHLIGREIDADTMLMGTAIIGMTIAVTLYALSAREEAATVRDAS